MPTKHALSITVTEHLVPFVRMEVASGRYSSATEVIRAGLRLLEEQTLRRLSLARKHVLPSKRQVQDASRTRRAVEKT
ncbi:type II toxin-antitoxin system ParD family antitoxin [Caballeronia sp. GAWG1-5s-s]|uniref:type II toxin-antitoxin system ParD family antitoxin n=1 Tax=Caballeronia sp. GAWG1-5s-s TaxID=2921743 RepID=UPI0020283D53|nr:type II toxin-antitoxin system ParD family antitoxin [Caballeronia sp. GAWG1-5s-s]